MNKNGVSVSALLVASLIWRASLGQDWPSYMGLPPLSTKAEETLKNTKTIRLIVEQAYKDAPSATLPLREVVSLLYENAGIEVVGGESDSSDVTLRVDVRGEALKEMYQVKGQFMPEYLYTGAKFKGFVSFRQNGKDLSFREVSWLEAPPKEVTTLRWTDERTSAPTSRLSMGSPRGAPFHVFLRWLTAEISDDIYQCWGATPLTATLDKIPLDLLEYPGNRTQVTLGLIIALGRTKDPGVIPWMLRAAEEDNYTAKYVGRVLYKNELTGPTVEILKKDFLSRTQVVNLLYGLVRDSKDSYSGKAIDARKQVCTGAFEFLVGLLAEKRSVRGGTPAILAALRTATGQAFDADAAKWQKWWDQNKHKYEQ